MRVNPQTGQLENDDGTPVTTAPNPWGPGVAVPMDQVTPAAAGPPPGMLAANQRAGRDLSMPVVLDRGGNDLPPMGLPPQVLPEAQAPAAPVVPPMVRDTSTTSRTREVPLPQEREAMKRVTANDEEAVAIAGRQGEVDKQKAATEAESAQARAAARQLQATQTSATVDQGQAAVADAKAKYDAENARLSGMDVRGYWDDKSVGQKVLAAISIAMSGVGAALTGRGGNSALDVINKAVDDDYRLQRARIDVQARKVEGAKEGMQMARQTHADAIANLELKQAATWNQIGAAAEAKAAQNGTQSAAVQAARIQQEAAAKRDAHLEQWFEGQRAKVTSTTTSVTGTGTAGGAAAGRAFGKAADLAMFGTEVAENEKRKASLGLTPAEIVDARRKVQQNETNMRIAGEGHGAEDAAKAWALRGVGVIPLSRLSGLSEKQKLWVAADDVSEKKTATLLERSTTPSAQHATKETIGINADDTPATIAQKQEERARIARENIALANKAGGLGDVTNAAANAGQRAPTSTADDQAAIQWAHAHPNDPRARSILQLHGM